MYAVLETGGKQYRVIAGDKLEIERLEVEAGKPVTRRARVRSGQHLAAEFADGTAKVRAD